MQELVDVLVELGQRLDNLEAMAVEAAGVGGDPLETILARLNAFDNRLARLERHLRRPPPFPVTLIENVDDTVQRKVDKVSYDLSTGLATERHLREHRDNDLLMLCISVAMAAFVSNWIGAQRNSVRMRGAGGLPSRSARRTRSMRCRGKSVRRSIR